jgi:predicted branched-subunit amino acid permease
MPGVSATQLRRGVVEGAPTLLAVAPFGFVFGALAIQAGLDLTQTMAMTTLVVAGASQLAAVQLIADNAPAWLALATATVVNLRMAMYSAVMARQWRGAPLRLRAAAAFLLHDGAFALAVKDAALRPEAGWPDRIGYFLGVGLVTVIGWLAASAVGAVLGGAAPAWLGLEHAAPLMFLAVLAPLLRTGPHVASALAAAVGAAAFAGLPLGLGLLVGAALGVAAGAGAETLTLRRRAAKP